MLTQCTMRHTIKSAIIWRSNQKPCRVKKKKSAKHVKSSTVHGLNAMLPLRDYLQQISATLHLSVGALSPLICNNNHNRPNCNCRDFYLVNTIIKPLNDPSVRLAYLASFPLYENTITADAKWSTWRWSQDQDGHPTLNTVDLVSLSKTTLNIKNSNWNGCLKLCH